MAYKDPDYKKIARIDDVGMEVLAPWLVIGIVVFAATAVALGIFIGSAFLSFDTLSPEQLEQLEPYILG